MDNLIFTSESVILYERKRIHALKYEEIICITTDRHYYCRESANVYTNVIVKGRRIITRLFLSMQSVDYNQPDLCLFI